MTKNVDTIGLAAGLTADVINRAKGEIIFKFHSYYRNLKNNNKNKI